MNSLLRKGQMILVTSLMLGVLGAGVIAGFSDNKAAAAACDKVSIIYCGIDKDGLSADIAAFQSHYNSNKSGHAASSVKQDYTDLKAVYQWAGITPTMVNSMNAQNTKVGTLYRDGRIVVDGKTVGTDAWVTARFSNGNGFVPVTGNVYARKTTTSFQNPTAQVLVFMQDDQMVGAVMTECGNSVKATPIKKVTPPTPEKPVVPVTPVTPTPPTPPTPTPVIPVAAPVVETPKELPQTGPASTVGLFSGVAIAGTSLHHLIRRRLAKS